MKGDIMSTVLNSFQCDTVENNICTFSNKFLISAVERLIFELSRFPKVVVAAVNGVTSGLGKTKNKLFNIL